MNRLIALTFSVVLCTYSNIVTAQSRNNCIVDINYVDLTRLYELDDDDNVACWKKNRQQGYSYQFDIENPNPFKYDLKIVSAKPVNYRVGVPTALAAYFGLVNLDQAPVVPGRTIPTVIPLTEPKNIKEETFSIDSIIAKFPKDVLEVSEDSKYVQAANNNFIMPETVKNLLRAAEVNALTIELENQKEQRRYFEKLLSSYEVLRPIIDEFDLIYNELVELDIELAAFQSRISRQAVPSSQDIKNKLDSIKSRYSAKNIKEVSDLVEEKQLRLKSLNETVEEALGTNIIIDQPLIESVSSVNSAINYIEAKAKLKTRLALLANLEGARLTQKTPKLDYSRRADATRINLLLTDKYTKDTVLSQRIDVPVYRGLDVEFSTGFVFNSLYQRNYFLEPQIRPDENNPMDTVNIISQQDDFEGDIAFAAFGHFSFRTPFARVGPSLGVGVGLTDAKVRYMVGGHLMVFGKKQSVGLTGGLVWARINTLSDQVSTNDFDPIDDIPQTLTAVPVLERMKRGYFVGLVWNFARR